MSTFETISARLRAASPRERRMMVIAGGVVAAGALLSLADWTHRERLRLAVALPAAEARLARMQDQADELGRLRRLALPPATSVQVRADAARAAAAARGLALEVEVGTDGVTVTGRGNPAPLLEWLAAMQSEQRLRPVELALTAVDGAVAVDGRFAAVGTDTDR